MSLLFATAPGTWGVEPAGSPLDPPWTQVVDEIGRAGFDGAELGPLGYLPQDRAGLRAALADRRLALAGGFVMEPFHLRAEHDRIRRRFSDTCTTLVAGGAETVVLIEAIVPERSRTAGRSDAAQRLDAARWADLVALVGELAELAAERYGLAAVFHPHAGTQVEFGDELERLLAAIDAELLGLCLDSGHALYAGLDPAALASAHAGRLRHVHAKDLRADVLERARAERRGFEQAVADGIFCPLGAGAVDLGGLLAQLARDGYDGWVVYEQDRPAGDPGALVDARASLDHLRTIASVASDHARPRSGAR